METVKTASRLGPFDVPDTFAAGFMLVSGLNAVHFLVFYYAPVMSMFAPLFGITQFLYSGPLVAEFILTGKKNAAKGAAVGAIVALAITMVRLIGWPWNEGVYFEE